MHKIPSNLLASGTYMAQIIYKVEKLSLTYLTKKPNHQILPNQTQKLKQHDICLCFRDVLKDVFKVLK